VQELRKPSVPAWTINQLVRRNRKQVDALLAAGERLEESQKALLAGGGQPAFAEAREREHEALKPLREAARAILGTGASEGTLERVASTLRAAVVTADGRSQLVEGRLTTEIDPPGFEAFAGTPLVETARPKRAPSPASQGPEKRAPKPSAKALQEAKSRARANLKAARDRESALAGELRKADEAVAEARKALETAEQNAERVRVERAAAADAVETARQELDRAAT
jgi:hypothetical protein